jgi:endonuclease/exonuclease/phosphatase family metal-dependent hydrolase
MKNNIKILCLNLWEGGILWENLKEFFRREKPDVLCLQEVFDGNEHQPSNLQSISNLKKLLPGYFFHFSPELHEIRPTGQGNVGNVIFSRFPILNKKTIFLHSQYQRIVRPADEKDFSHYPKNLIGAKLDIQGKNLFVYNLHGIWGLPGFDTPERLKMSRTIIKEIRGKKPAVLMGDFNLRQNTETIKNIENNMNNVFKNDIATSFNMRHKTDPGYAEAVVDLFFASPDVKIVSKTIPEDDVSDHKPLLGTIEI